MIRPPCKNHGKDCEFRTPTCHSNCKQYLSYQAEKQKEHAYIAIENRLTDMQVGAEKKTRHRWKHSHGKN